MLEAQAAGLVAVSSDGERQRVQTRLAVSEALASALVAGRRGKQPEQVGQQIERHNALVCAAQAPAHRGAVFKPLPRLCYRLEAPTGQQGELVLLEREAVFDTVELDLLGRVVGLPGFTMVEQAAAWEVYLDGQKLRVGRGEASQLPLVYPDFVGELTDGRLLVVEYKGAQIRGMPKEIEKGQVGRLWAGSSGGRCCFAMVFKLEDGMTMTQQIDAALG